MCYDIAYMTRYNEKLVQRYGAELPAHITLPMYYHVRGFARPELPVITLEQPRWIQLYRWGLIPAWVKEEARAATLALQTLNAMAETIFQKPSFRSSIRTQRCLVLVDGFYEWQNRGQPNNKKVHKQPYFICMKSRDVFSLGGIYSHWIHRATGEVHHTFSIVTVPANALLARIHNTKKRMPLILPPDREKQWIASDLSVDQIRALMQPIDDDWLTAWPVSTLISRRGVDTNVPEVMEPISGIA